MSQSLGMHNVSFYLKASWGGRRDDKHTAFLMSATPKKPHVRWEKNRPSKHGGKGEPPRMQDLQGAGRTHAIVFNSSERIRSAGSVLILL